MTAAASPAVVVDRLEKRYGGRAAVQDISLTVERGEIVAVLGPNGAGKTTTLEIIEGYRTPDSGTVRVLGADPARAGRDWRARIGLMLQSGGIDLRARPAESLRQHAGFHERPDDPDRLLDMLGLRAVADTPYRRLSGGERQRLAFGLALVGRPEVLVLDEPTAGMDPEGRGLVRTIVAEQRAAGVAILLTSHELTDVERMADRVAILVGGRLAAMGTPSTLAAGVRPRLRFRLDSVLDAAGLRSLGDAVGAPVAPTGDGAWLEVLERIPTPELVSAVATACARLDRLIVESRTVGGSLEDAYLELVAPRARA